MRALFRTLVLAVAVATAGTALGQVETASFFSPNRWALVIGAGQYPNLGNLDYAASDAKTFSETLRTSYSFDQAQVSLLTDGSGSTARPTSAKIKAELDRILANPRLQKSDLFVFYFSGHGVSVKGKDLLMATDAKVEDAEKYGLPVQDVVTSIVKAGVQNVLIVTDACRSGEQNQFGNELIRLGREANIAILLGCAPGGRSYELPREGRGALTHFLVKAMEDESLRDTTTGALWASNLAERVQKDVETATAKEQGREFRQVPSVWCQRNQDIFLGAFVGRGGVSPAVLAQVQERGEGVTPEVYGRYLIALANVALVSAEPEIAVQASRLYTGLGLKDGLAYAIEAVATEALGRTVESEAAYKKLNTEFPEHYTAYLYRTLYATTFADRRKAAEAMLAKFGDFIAGYTLYLATVRDPESDPQDTVKVLDRLAKTFPENSGRRSYFTLLSQAYNGDPVKALDGFGFPEFDGVRPEYVEMLGYDLAAATGDSVQLLAMIQRIMERTSYPHAWEEIERPTLLDAVPIENWEAAGLKLLEIAKSPERVWTALHLLLSTLDKHAGEFAEVEKKFPYAWKAQSASWFAQLAATKTAKLEMSEKLLAAGMDKASNRAQLYALMVVGLEMDWAAWEFQMADGWQRHMLKDLADNPMPELGDYWFVNTIAAQHLVRIDLLDFLAAKRSHPMTARHPDYQRMLLGYYLNAGDDDQVLELLDKIDPSSQLASDALLRLLALKLVKGDVDEVRDVIEDITAGGGETPTTLKVLLELADAIEGEPRPVEDLLGAPDITVLDVLLSGLAESYRPEPNLETINSAFEVGMVQDTWAYAALLKRYASLASGEHTDQAANQLLVRTETPFRGITVKEMPPMENKGSLTLESSVSLRDEPEVEGKLEVSWESGKATVTITAGQTKLTFTGTIAPNGHIHATGQFAGSTAEFDMRLMPVAWLTKQEGVYGVARFISAKGHVGLADFSMENKPPRR